MDIFRRPLRYLGSPCLAFLLGTALAPSKAQTRAPEALQTVSPQTQLKPAPDDEYQNLWSQVVKNARVETAPRLKNPAIASDGLAPGVVSALREQRDYWEAHAPASSALAPVNAAHRELIGENSRKPKSPSQYPPCREPGIRSVNGKANGVMFTPMAADNRYLIEGCFFGDAPGTVQLEAGSGPRPSNAIPVIPLPLDSTYAGAWSDHEISVKLDPQLGGVPDYPVTLVIHRGDHRRIQLRGCRFVAARGSPQLLSMIPSAWVHLYPSGVGTRSIRQLEYVSPPAASGAAPKDATGLSAFVVRSDPEQFGIGRDIYDFSQLNPGWVVESVQLQTYSISCPESAALVQLFGSWEADWTPLGLRVAFEDSVCASSAAPSFVGHLSLSQYAIRVLVVGPVATQPLALSDVHISHTATAESQNDAIVRDGPPDHWGRILRLAKRNQGDSEPSDCCERELQRDLPEVNVALRTKLGCARGKHAM